MTFTFAQARRMSPEESSPWNNMIPNAMKMYQQNINAQYAKPKQQAEIFNKRMTPLSQLAASPMFLALHPEQQQQIANMISQSMVGDQDNQGGDHSGHNGWLNGENIIEAIKNHPPFQRHNNSQQGDKGDMQNTDGTYNPKAEASTNIDMSGGHKEEGRVPTLPAKGQDLTNSVRTNTLAGLNKSPYKPGETFVDPVSGEARTTLTPGNLESAQGIISGAKGLAPIVERIKENSAPFLKRGGELGHLSSQAAGWLARHGVSKEITDLMGGNKLTNLDAKVKGDITKAVEQAYAAYNLPMNAETTKKLEHIFTPTSSEDLAGFNDRLESELNELVQRKGRATKNIGGGINLNEPTISKYEKERTNQQAAERKRANAVSDKMRASENNKVEIFDPDGKSWMISPNEVASYRAHWKNESKKHK